MKPKLAAIAGITVLLLALVIMLLPEAPVEVLEFGSSEILRQRGTSSPKKGDPDRFFQYHHDIRTSKDGVNNEYPMGYRIKEFEKALVAAKTPATKLNWTERGPGNVGGRTRALLVDPADPSMHTWWAGSVSGGLWKTTDGGARWIPLTEHLPNLSVSSLAMAESNPDIIYMGTGEGMAGAGAVTGDGIFKSYNRGETWVHLISTTDNYDFRFVNRIAVDPSNPDVVLAATDRGIFRSTDGGESWEQTLQTRRASDLRVQPGNFDRQIASLDGEGILVSDNAGLTWEFASVDHVDREGRIELAYSPSHPNIAYAAADGAIAAQLYRSDDGGLNWGRTTEPNGISWFGGQGWFNNTLAVHPFSPDTVFVGGIRLWRAALSDPKVVRRIPGKLDEGASGSWLEFQNIGGPAFNGRAYYRDSQALDVRESDYSNIEIRFGQGSQKAHRFWVSETAGPHDNGGPDVPFSEYRFADYVDVPFQVWDVDDNRQLMVSFRDQAEDGEFNLIEPHSTEAPGTRNLQSYEFIFIHKHDYDDAAPDSRIARDGRIIDGMLYGLLPVLTPGAAWTPYSLPKQTVKLELKNIYSYVRSTDKGIDTYNLVHVDHHGIYPLPIDEARNEYWILNTNDGGVAVSKDNGKTFHETDDVSSGYNTSQVYGMAKAPGISSYIAGFQDNGTWMSGTQTGGRHRWDPAYGGDGLETVWHSTDGNKILATTQRGGVVRTTNGGAVWSLIRPANFVSGLFVTSIDNSDLAPDDVYLVERDGVYISRDFGLTWARKSIRHAWGAWDGCKVRVSIADPDVVWAGCGLDPEVMLHVSKDRAESFEPVVLPSVANAPESYISGLATHPAEAGTAYALFACRSCPKILETKDYGQVWTDLTGFASSYPSTNGFPDVAVYDLITMPHAPHVLWAGTEIGIFVSNSGGAQWHYADNGLPAVSVWRMKIRDGELIVGTHGRGVWTLPLSDINVATAVEELTAELPSEFSLSQNYPNPFNTSTNIEFSVPRESHVRLVVFDVTGRKVSELTDQVYAPGVHRLQWNADAYSSGVYLYRMELNGRIAQTRRMTLAE